MAEVDVHIFKGGLEVGRVKRPLHDVDGKPAVKYDRKLWPLINGDEVHLDGIPPIDRKPDDEPAPNVRGVPMNGEVRIFKGGREIKRIKRVPQDVGGEPAIKYHRKLWPLINGDEVHLDEIPSIDRDPDEEPAPNDPVVPLAGEIRIFKGGREIKRIKRVPRDVGGKPYITYKGRRWPLINGDEVHLDGIPPTDPGTEDEPAPDVPVVPLADIVWDDSQRAVIEAPPGDRLLVAAGPGMGKTAVACARVSQLINQNGLEPSNIWLISFTRTAVREVRDRLEAHLQDHVDDPAAAYAVKIATLDSRAWTIHAGFDEEAKILDSHEKNIESVVDLVRQDDDVAGYLEGVEHLIVDEAQDIVDIRAELVVGMIGKLSSVCGVTIFADEAQAIYGFADDREVAPGEKKSPPLSQRIRDGAAGTFRECELTQIHRTDSPELLGIFSDTRRKVLAESGETEDKLAEIKDEVKERAHGKTVGAKDPTLARSGDAFMLFRRRCDVLLASSMLMDKGTPHRVRMSGLPTCLAPWVGATLSEHTDPDLTQDRFIQLWGDHVNGTSLATCEADEAWLHLYRIAGRSESVIDMLLLRRRLGRKQPPPELCSAELGTNGPIVGTIHASKGREANTVYLMLPDMRGSDVDEDEEARVVFVGATRARSRLLVGSGFRTPAARIGDAGRAYSLKTWKKEPRAQFEIGHEADIGAEGLAGRSYFADPDAVRAAQTRIRDFADQTASLVAESDSELGYAYRLLDQEHCLAVLCQTVNRDLFTISKAIENKLKDGKRKPPNSFKHLHVRGLRSIVLPSDAPQCEALHEPWRSSGIMLAPLVLGYTTACFRRRGPGRRKRDA